MEVVFFGSSKYVLSIIEVLRKNFDLPLVLTTEKLETEPVRSYYKAHSIPCLSVQQFNNKTMTTIREAKASLGVLAYFGLILPKQVLGLFPKGILNIHPSLLPKYRGPTPGQTAILDGEVKTGVTLIKLDEEVDHGPIIAQIEEPILQNDTAETLYERLFAIGIRLLEENINSYLNNKVVLKEQDHSRATFTNQLSRQDGFIDLDNSPSPEKLDRMIRAYHPWPGVWTKFRIKNLAARGEPRQRRELRIKFLPDKKIQVEGGKPMTYKDFVNGYPDAKELLEQVGLLEGK